MNLFFGPAGRQFDSEQVQLKRMENEVRSLTTSLEQQAVDQWLEPLANLFVAGMRNGIHAASNDREMRFSANPVVSVKVDDQNMNEVENRLFHQLISFLNQADSVEFMTMDDTIATPIVRRNQVQCWDDLYDLAKSKLTLEDLFEIVLGGWRFGYQNFEYGVHHKQDLKQYQQSQQRADDALAATGFSDYERPESQKFLLHEVRVAVGDYLETLAMA